MNPLGDKLAPRSLDQSQRLLARARELIPGASQTVSKGPTQWVQGVAPAFVRSASGVEVVDVDGNRYLDFPMALGPVILGHCHPGVDEAIRRQLESGITFTLPHELEIEVAERIVAMVPGAERVRFGKTGSDATSAAVRASRAFTGRDRVVVTGYHGWHDWYVGSTSRRLGVPQAVQDLVTSVPALDLEALDRQLEEWSGEVACVMLEPVGLREPEPSELRGAVERAHNHGALCVFDEIITGFRLAPGGAQERYGVVPDLATYGKALGNGMPLSALAGRAEVMDVLQEAFFSGTHGGEALSLAAARVTLDVLNEPATHPFLWERGAQLQAGLLEQVKRWELEPWVGVGGAAPWTLVTVKEPAEAEGLPAKALLQQELLKRGVLFNGSHFICLAHSEQHIDAALEAYDGAFETLAEALPDGVGERLEGPAVAQVFRPVA